MGTVNEELDLALLAKLLHGLALPLELLLLAGLLDWFLRQDCYSWGKFEISKT